MIEQGLDVVGTSIDGKLVEMIELPSHKWFLACQFHPEFTSILEMDIQYLIAILKAPLQNNLYEIKKL